MRGWSENPKVHYKERISEVSAPSEAAVAETLQREGRFANTKGLGKVLFGHVDIQSVTSDSESEEPDYGGSDDEEDLEQGAKNDKDDGDDGDDDDDEQSTEEQKKEKKMLEATKPQSRKIDLNRAHHRNE